MIPAFSVAAIRQAEAARLQSDANDALMRRAAHAVAAAVLDHLPDVVGRSAVLLVGTGNNGGDALFAGSLLRRRGMAVTAVLSDPDRVHAAGLRAFRRAGGRVVPESLQDKAFAHADVVVDGLLGLAGRPPLRPELAALIEKGNRCNGFKVAVDLPSGLDPDSGQADAGTFRADLTVTFGGMKTGLLVSDAFAGQVVVVDLGFEPANPQVFWLTDQDVRVLLPDPGRAGDKFSGGVPGIVAGSTRYPGAAVLSVGAAVRTRPGMVRYAGPAAAAVLSRWPEVVATKDLESAGQVQAWVAGPGMGTDDAARSLLRAVLATDGAVLVDADGLTLLAADMDLLNDRRGRPTLLTPHDGEFARLFPDLDPADRLASVRAAAKRCGATILLKGHRTLVADPSGRVAVNTTGSSWLATAGSGDVLSGILGSLLAAGLPPWEAGAAGAHLHGRAGERASAARVAGAQGLWNRIRVPGW